MTLILSLEKLWTLGQDMTSLAALLSLWSTSSSSGLGLHFYTTCHDLPVVPYSSTTLNIQIPQTSPCILNPHPAILDTLLTVGRAAEETFHFTPHAQDGLELLIGLLSTLYFYLLLHLIHKVIIFGL